MLLNHSNIKKIQEKPVVFQWIDNKDNVCDPCNLCDPTQHVKPNNNNDDYDTDSSNSIDESEIESRSHMAHRSNSDYNVDKSDVVKGFQLSPNGPIHLMNEENNEKDEDNSRNE